MQYEKIKSAEVDQITQDTLRNAAVAAELEALAADLQVKYADVIAAANPPEAIVPTGINQTTGQPTGPTVAQLVETAQAEQDRLGRRTSRKLGRAGIERDAASIVQAKKAYLNDRIEALEREHLANAVRLADRQAALADAGEHGPSDDERVQLTAAVAGHQANLDIIEKVHAAAVAELRKLDGEAGTVERDVSRP